MRTKGFATYTFLLSFFLSFLVSRTRLVNLDNLGAVMKYGLLVLNEVLVQPLVAFNFEVGLFASWEPRLESLSMNDKVVYLAFFLLFFRRLHL